MRYSFTQSFHKKIEFFMVKIKVLEVLVWDLHNNLRIKRMPKKGRVLPIFK